MSNSNEENKTLGYVIYHKSGLLLFDHDMKKISVESGVLQNMLNTFQKTSQNGTTVPIEELEIGDTNILLSKSDGLPIWHAVLANKDEDKNMGYKVLGSLINHFENLYEDAQQKKIKSDFFKHEEYANQVSEIIESSGDKDLLSFKSNEAYSLANSNNSVVG